MLKRLLEHDISQVCISSITYSELAYGVEKSQAKDKNRVALALLLAGIEVLDYDANAAEEYWAIRAELERNGTPIGGMDMLIAAHAKALGCTLVTNNEREFKRIDGLSLENWAAEA